ncbi:Mariner Mos1 transposase [Eumeta japonica]|uniref:Mariner Mos1 transposase n=1 Tax=Eumeta variegata TaxID=151549 RepID=A0A4C1U7U5_EUMVA|nr:Mariner Mos1 transposase [Eumeta japonica]
MRLKQEAEKKRPELINREGVVFHHDDARLHTSLATQQILREFDWEVLMRSPYGPDLAPSDFHLFSVRCFTISDLRDDLRFSFRQSTNRERSQIANNAISTARLRGPPAEESETTDEIRESYADKQIPG